MIYLSFFSHLNLAFLQKNKKKKTKDKNNKIRKNEINTDIIWKLKNISPKPCINLHWRPDYHTWSIFKNEM